ncbi:MAG: hypothetical protein AB1331_06865 [Bacillota bacterium]
MCKEKADCRQPEHAKDCCGKEHDTQHCVEKHGEKKDHKKGKCCCEESK